MSVKPTGNKEESARYYDDIYSRVGGYPTDRFSDVYVCVMEFLFSNHNAKILECGCGVGTLAELVLQFDLDYQGFDFSRKAIQSCPYTVQRFVQCANAYNKLTWAEYDFDTLIAVETFEHLQDLYILKYVPKDTRVIFSVPNFNSKSHLRTYHDLDGIKEYYSGVLEILEAIKIHTKENKFITVCNAVKL